ncbi:uncharacterized protein LOC128247069 [Octopus bimaculoides]|uniref:uncharacterized protein LOC128247069 n=1 Tax=Octopus bimaculoides TaxID=37653 RepID=UPI0022DF40BC|nr:uncharacterized protein LOC128247069 [Octopus bimaculoides]
MELLIDTTTKCEVRAVIWFLNAKGIKPIEIHHQLTDVNGESCMVVKNVHKWCREFEAGRTEIHDDERSGQPSISDETVTMVDRLFVAQDSGRIRLLHGCLSSSIWRGHCSPGDRGCSRKGEPKVACLSIFGQFSATDGCPSCARKTKSLLFIKSGRNLNISCWNVRILLDNKSDCKPERRTALVARELNRYKIDITALSETRIEGDGQLEEVGDGYTFFWNGRQKEERREAGVGFAVRSDILKKLEELPVPINERIMTLRLHLKGKLNSHCSKKTSKVTSNKFSWKWTKFGIMVLSSTCRKRVYLPKNIHADVCDELTWKFQATSN